MPGPAGRTESEGCVRCGELMPPPAGRGRPAVFCSARCRKAAYDARRALLPGAYEVKIVERTVEVEHDLSECVERVMTSPAACRRVLQSLIELTEREVLTTESRWAGTLTAARRLTETVTSRRY